MIKGIAHLAFKVTDMEKAIAYYCDGLGFTKAFEINDNEDRPWIVYIKVSDGQFIELFYNAVAQEREANAAGYAHLCLEVDDINEIADRLVNKGLPLDVKPNQGKDLNMQCWSHDPDGNPIEFMQMSPDSPQAKA